MMYDVLATVGTPAAVKVVLQKIDRLPYPYKVVLSAGQRPQLKPVVLWGSLLQSVSSPEALILLLVSGVPLWLVPNVGCFGRTLP